MATRKITYTKLPKQEIKKGKEVKQEQISPYKRAMNKKGK